MCNAFMLDLHVILVRKLLIDDDEMLRMRFQSRLPTSSGEKVTLGLTCFVAFSVFMLMVAEKVPATSDTVPIIGKHDYIELQQTREYNSLRDLSDDRDEFNGRFHSFGCDCSRRSLR
jgi:hypothetical protein